MKPILGFGWIGVIASVVLAALLAVWIAGVDVQELYIHGVCAVIGPDALMIYVGWIHVFHGLALSSPEFSMVTLLVTIVALRIHPKRIAWWRYALVIAWGLLRPTGCWHSYVSGPLTLLITSHSFLSPPATQFDWLVVTAIQEIPSAFVLAVATKSWRIGVGAACASLVVYGADYTIGLSGFMPVILWQGIVAASLLTWSIHPRLYPQSPTGCPRCGYELAAVTSERCPECGAVRALSSPAAASQ